MTEDDTLKRLQEIDERYFKNRSPKSYTLDELEELRYKFCKGGSYDTKTCCKCDDDYYCCPISDFLEWIGKND